MGDRLDAFLGFGDTSGQDAGDDAESLTLVRLSPAAIEPNAFQPREEFDEEELEGLAASIGEVGLLQPVVVRRIDEYRYELIAGERRWRAAQRAGLSEIPAIVKEADDQAALEQAVVENLHREDLNAVEEAAAYRQLMEDFALTQDAVAQRVGKSRSAVANTLRLLQLPEDVLALVRRGLLAAGHARALLTVLDPGAQSALAHRVVAEDLSVRQVEELVRAAVKARGAPDKAPVRSEAGKAAALLEIEQLLSERLETRVSVTMTRNRGRVVVEFADLDDLDRIYRELGR